MTGGRPDLSREMDDRGFAICAGHSGNRPWLPAAKTRRYLRQPAMRIRIDDYRDAREINRCQAESLGVVGQNRDSATRNCFARE